MGAFLKVKSSSDFSYEEMGGVFVKSSPDYNTLWPQEVKVRRSEEMGGVIVKSSPDYNTLWPQEVKVRRSGDIFDQAGTFLKNEDWWSGLETKLGGKEEEEEEEEKKRGVIWSLMTIGLYYIHTYRVMLQLTKLV